MLQTSYILGKTFLPFVSAQNALRVVIHGIVYSILFTPVLPRLLKVWRSRGCCRTTKTQGKMEWVGRRLWESPESTVLEAEHRQAVE